MRTPALKPFWPGAERLLQIHQARAGEAVKHTRLLQEGGICLSLLFLLNKSSGYEPLSHASLL